MENKITKEEKEILESFFYYKWIARDHNGNLYIYNNKPFKTDDFKYIWQTNGDFEEFPLGHDLFPFIKFEDKEPYRIGELMKNAK